MSRAMTATTIKIFQIDDVSITYTDGGGTPSTNPLTQSDDGQGFVWQNSAFTITVPATAEPVEITLDDADGEISDDPYDANGNASDQALLEAVTLNGTVYSPSSAKAMWQGATFVEDEYEVTLFDAAGKGYTVAVMSVTSGYTTSIVGLTFDGASPPAGTALYYIPGRSVVSDYQSLVPCFLRGTRIATPRGEVAIEELVAGDLVETLDHGPQPLVWVGSRRAEATGDQAPIRIRPGALGNRRDLLVSPNHRMLLSGPMAEVLFGEAEVLVPAKFLVNDRDIRRSPRRRAEYFHLLFARHQVIFAEGAPAESLFPGELAAQAFATPPPAPRAEMPLARYSLSAPEARALARA